jgi:PST family polysaccharide transporter/lipopolysaccharide exporter
MTITKDKVLDSGSTTGYTIGMGFGKVYERVRGAATRLLLGDGLRDKAMRGGVWLGGGSVAEQGSRFARNMVLTRLLAPNAFGTMAIVLSSSSVISSFTDVGVKAAVIHNPRGGEAAYLNAAWWLSMGRAICVYLIVFAAAPWIARFYGNPELSALLRVALLSTLLDGALSPRATLAQKEMKLGRWSAITNGGAICGVVLTVVLSFIIRDVWALAIGYCAENAFRCILSYILCPGLPSLGWDKHAVRDLLKFSKGVFGLSFLNLIFARADIFVLAKLYSPTALGLYTMAVYLVQTPSVFLLNLLTQTLLPVFSHVQDDSERMNRILAEVTSWVILLGLPAMVVMGLCGPAVLTVVYGARYAVGAGPLAVACAVVLLNMLNVLITSVFYAGGRPALHRRAVTASAITVLIVIYPACRYLGVVGGQVAALLAILVSYSLQLNRVRTITGLNLLRYGRAFIPAAAVSAGVLGAGLGVGFLGLATTPVSRIALGAAACITAYSLCVPAFRKIREAA